MIDGRLVVPAAAAWAGAVLVIAFGDPTDRRTVALHALLIAVVVAGLLIGLVWRRPTRSIVAAACVGAVVGVGSATLQVLTLTAEPLAGWVSNGSSATVTGVVTTDAVSRARPGAAVWQSANVTEARLATSAIVVRGEPMLVDVPLTMRVSGSMVLPDPGARVVVSGRLGRARASDVAAILHVRHGGAITVVAEPGVLDALATAMRSGLRTALANAPPDAAALVAGLSVGDESMQPVDLDDAMRSSGLSHLTAVSGGNVAIILAVVLGLARLGRLRIRTQVVLAMCALAFFVVLVRPQPSVVRAAVMGAVMILALMTGGGRSGPGVLATAVLLVVIVSPSLAVSWAFGLSACATAGLILLAPPILDRLARARTTARWPPVIREGLAVTTAAQVATAPLLIAMGAAFGWVAIPANLLAMPAVAPVTVLGLLAALTSFAPPVAMVIATAASWPARWIAQVAHTCSALPFAAVPWPSGLLGVLLLIPLTVGLWLTVHALRRRFPHGIPRDLVLAILAPLVLALGVLTLAPPGKRGWPPPGWLLVMCDVGQGDGMVVRVDDETAIAIDAGPDPRAIRACLDDLGVRSVSAVILTHFHADHVNGLPGVLAHRAVGSVFVTPIGDPPQEVSMVDRWLAPEGLHAQVVQVGEVRSVGDVTWRVLWPRRVITSGSIPNNASIVLALDVAGTTFLLPGDVEAEAQTALIAQEPTLRVDVMKVPHHGSRNQDPRLPSWSRARIALVSVGVGNTYGHPTAQTLDAWHGAGALVGRTDLDGDLAVVRGPDGLGLVSRGG